MNRAFSAKRILPLAMPVMVAAFALPCAAQSQGPLPHPPSSEDTSSSPTMVRSTPASRSTSPESRSDSDISNTPPSIPVDQIIQRFSQHETEFRRERDNYTYTQTFVIQTVDFDGNPDGEYRMNSDILFTPDGKRYEKITYAPPDSLRRITMSKQDLDDLKNIQPFV